MAMEFLSFECDLVNLFLRQVPMVWGYGTGDCLDDLGEVWERLFRFTVESVDAGVRGLEGSGLIDMEDSEEGRFG